MRNRPARCHRRNQTRHSQNKGTSGHEVTWAAKIDAGTPLFAIARSKNFCVFGVSEVEDVPAASEGVCYYQSRVRIAFLYGDASVPRINNTIDLTVYQFLCTVAGGESHQKP